MNSTFQNTEHAIAPAGREPAAAPLDATSSIEKALDVLFHVAGAGSAGVSEIARALALPKSTAHRLLAALGRRGLIERDAGGRYKPGLRILALGLGVLEREPIVAAARPVLEAAAEEIGETLFLAAARGGRIVVLDKAEGTGFLRAAPRVGSEVPVHATAVGKLQLAFDPDSVSLPVGAWPRFTPRTPTSRRALEREVARARKRGWAENREEWMPGLVVLAAPVVAAGRMQATLALAALSVRLPAAKTERVARKLVAAAAKIGARLEGSAGREAPGPRIRRWA
jgi:DNA-binding IclR family transcriptional regulator